MLDTMLHIPAAMNSTFRYLRAFLNWCVKRGYIETLICPPGALVPMSGDFSFLEAPDFHTDGYIHCG